MALSLRKTHTINSDNGWVEEFLGEDGKPCLIRYVRITCTVANNSARARKAWRERLTHLGITAQPLTPPEHDSPRHGDDDNSVAYSVSYRVSGPEDAVADLVRSSLVLAWNQCDAKLPYSNVLPPLETLNGKGERVPRSRPVPRSQHGVMGKANADKRKCILASEKHFRNMGETVTVGDDNSVLAMEQTPQAIKVLGGHGRVSVGTIGKDNDNRSCAGIDHTDNVVDTLATLNATGIVIVS